MKQNTNNKNCDDKLIRRYYQNECSAEEKLFVEQCFTDFSYAKDVTDIANDEWDNTDTEGDDKELLSDILYKIHYNLRLEDFRKSKSGNLRTRAISAFLKISAAALIPIMAINIWLWQGKKNTSENQLAFTEIHAPFGSRVNFNLPDGSTGWLNSGSTLSFMSGFADEERKVTLNGEGFFNVITNTEKPFVVATKHSQVRALGTSFNVLAYSDLDSFEEVTLQHGKVQIEKKMQDGTYRKALELRPSQHVHMDIKSKKIKVTDTQVDKYIDWKDGKLILRNDPLEYVIMKMERFYNAEIEVKSEHLYEYHFSATFADESLFETLRLLKVSSNIDYTILKRDKNEDGIYEKQRVILYQKTSR